MVGDGIMVSAMLALVPPGAGRTARRDRSRDKLTQIASSTADVGGVIAAIGGVIAACATTGLLIAAWKAGLYAKEQVEQLKEQLKQQERLLEQQQRGERQRRVYEHLARLQSREFVLMLSTAQELFLTKPNRRRKKQPNPNWQALWLKRDVEERAQIVTAMNFFEILAGEYNEPNYLDKPAADKALAIVADGIWEQARSFVAWYRTWPPPSEQEFCEWERMYAARHPVSACQGHAP
jgi:hypothetical protein